MPGGSPLKHETRPLYEDQAFVPGGDDTRKRFFNKNQNIPRTFCLNATNKTKRQWAAERGELGNRPGDLYYTMRVREECTFSRDSRGVYVPNGFLNVEYQSRHYNT